MVKDLANCGAIWFYISVKLLKVPGMVFNYFRGGYLHPPNKNGFKQVFGYFLFYLDNSIKIKFPVVFSI